MDLQSIAKYAISNALYLGVRTTNDDEYYKVGDTCRESYDWDYENDCSTYDVNGEDGLKAGGTCCTIVERDMTLEYKDDWEDEAYLNEVVESIKKSIEYNANSYFKYYGKQLILIASDENNMTFDADPGEGRLVDAQVLAVIKED